MTSSLFPAAILSLSAIACVACDRSPAKERPAALETTGATVSAGWQSVTRTWPESSKSAARAMVDKYGAPDEATATQLVWRQRGPWKRSVVSREEVHHEWPTPHEDVLEQAIDFRVPPDKFDEIAAFDGSVMVERTKGELSARCGGEPANFLAVNLAREVAEGQRAVGDARRIYETTMGAYKEKREIETSHYMKDLTFAPAARTSDPDRPATAAAAAAKE